MELSEDSKKKVNRLSTLLGMEPKQVVELAISELYKRKLEEIDQNEEVK